MSATYAELIAKREEINKEIEKIKSVEKRKIIQSIKGMMDEYDISLSDLRVQRPVATRKPVAIKFADAATGDTWTGRGKTPKWLQGKDKTLFQVN
jgi:DNA-binding protein H-NS